MMNREVLLREGMECLRKKLGLVEAGRFISFINARRFDYTEWRKENLPEDMTTEEIAKAAMEYDRKLESEENNGD
jgi:hypothetical protein